ncbi:hypothetical protein EV193_10321 [Herbihabitans rhizosphaerae]|uniref:Uncharacterized protein n=1 Tax=Herbihabitans rhizosphaerae TaxID=1872711 RepID=A0A4Q7KWP5_9PSEU|nr:hypothetical protein [Herbihabitans rhizosphaerae]RZS40710.1 hypothetical protein EV193_10321 [Herbihabitans rhizosphaerae]
MAALTDSTEAIVARILHTVRDSARDDSTARRIALALIQEPITEFSQDEQYGALTEALGSEVSLSTIIDLSYVPSPPSEEEFRAFLERVRAHLDANRPWPTPPHRGLDSRRWPSEYANAAVVGRIGLHIVGVRNKVKYLFRTEDGGSGRNVLLLRLRSGDEIALVTGWWSDSDDLAVLSRDPSRPANEVLQALIDATDFTSEDVRPYGEVGASES